uniref:Uncharacterized protein n=1 Tax=Arundo donax TaxID=35708 RepID=A0A0A9CUA4_ARUDO
MRSGKPDVSPNELYSQSAIYVAAAHALKPNYSVYRSALRLVRSMLPLPYLKVGYLTAPPANNAIAPHKEWERSQFILNHEGLQQADAPDQPPSQSHGHMDRGRKPVRINVADIISVSACSDLTLPSGAGLCVETIHGPTFFVCAYQFIVIVLCLFSAVHLLYWNDKVTYILHYPKLDPACQPYEINLLDLMQMGSKSNAMSITSTLDIAHGK